MATNADKQATAERAGATPVLLSGGNPDSATVDGGERRQTVAIPGWRGF